MAKRTRSQNGRRSRAKGAQWERDVVNMLRAIYPGASRNLAQTRSAAREGPDILGTPFWCELKCGGPAAYPARAFADAVHDRNLAGSDLPVLIIGKEDRKDPYVYGRIAAVATSIGFVAPVAHPVMNARVDFALWCLEVAVTQRRGIVKALVSPDPTEPFGVSQ